VRIALLDAAPPAGADAGAVPLAAGLAAGGHDVMLLCPRGRGSPPEVPGAAIRTLWRPPGLPAERLYEDHVALAPAAIWHLLRGRFDLAHAFAPALGWAAAQARRFGGPPFAYSHRCELTRRWLVDRHYRLEMMAVTASAASACFVDEAAIAAAFRRYLLRDPEVVGRDVAMSRYDAAYSALSAGRPGGSSPGAIT
jgi:hypothetical protein